MKILYADWNDVSDSESDEERHQQEQEHLDEVKDVPQELPPLNKIVSSPLPDKKNAGNFILTQVNRKTLKNFKTAQKKKYGCMCLFSTRTISMK